MEKPDKITKENLYTGSKVLWKYISQYKGEIITLSFMGIFSAIGNAVIPYIAGRFFDVISSDKIIHVLSLTFPIYIFLLIIWAIIQLITYVLDWRINILSEKFSNVIWLDYLSKGFGYLLLLPMSFHKTHKIGEVSQKINTAANLLETIAGRIVIDLSPQILSIIIAIIIAYILQPVLATILIIGIIIYILIFSTKIKNTSIYQKEYWNSLGFIWGDAHDIVGNALPIKQATAEDYEINRLSIRMKSAVPLWLRLTRLWGSLTIFQKITILLTQLAIFIISIGYIHAGTMTIGELLAFMSYASMVFGPFTVIARNWQIIQNGIVSIQDTEKILQTAPENYIPKDAIDTLINGNIEFKNVSFSYSIDKPILQNINFKVNAGETIALVGESGVGKSTFIDLISAYHFANEGQILINGIDIKKINLKKLRGSMAIVPQEVVLFNDTIKMNIKYGNFSATDEEIESATKKAHAIDFIEKFADKWEQTVGERGVKLSVGQKQRVAIARAILRNPKILILDEPTSALDAGSEKIITDSLEELMKNKTTFIIAHRLSTVRKANKILVFKEGRIVETGTHEELIKNNDGEYKRLYDLQIGLHA